jgi:amylosucrase
MCTDLVLDRLACVTEAEARMPAPENVAAPSDFEAGREWLARLLADDPDRDDVLDRWDRWAPDLITGLQAIYGDSEDFSAVVLDVAQRIGQRFTFRRPALRRRDRQRLINSDWFQRPDELGYAAYTDRFAGTLNGVRTKIPYLQRLGVTYLHLMPLLQPREGANDGGYAVADYGKVRSDLGTMDDLRVLADELHEVGISLTLDLVLNHVAREHAWAEQARGGSAKYRNYFRVYDDRTIPDQFERTLPEVFPAFAPGNFTWDESLSAWVWTTFNSWQWDLNWQNPEVFVEFVDIVLYLANVGVDVLRLDAIAFLWKRLGTTSQNEPEVHDITQALRAAAHIGAPSLLFKAEAIVAPDDLVQYLGRGKHAGKLSELAYHNSLMVQIWSALAARDARLMSVALSRFPVIPLTSAWATYVRCHDDIGWAIDDSDANAVGWNGADHRRFLSDFYSGDFPDSFARGEVFQQNIATGDRRISGSNASLLGLENALIARDPGAIDLALARIKLVYAMALGFGGLPLLYMGDELALVNDYGFADVPEHADDNRWVHRPLMPWDVVEALDANPDSPAAITFANMEQLIRVRSTLMPLHASVPTRVVSAEDSAVVLFARRSAAGDFVGVFNVADRPAWVDAWQLEQHGVHAPFDAISGRYPTRRGPGFELAPYEAWWLVDQPR